MRQVTPGAVREVVLEQDGAKLTASLWRKAAEIEVRPGATMTIRDSMVKWNPVLATNNISTSIPGDVTVSSC